MKRYVWQPHIAAPIFYPADAKYGFVYYGDNDSRFPIMDRTPRKGIAQEGGRVALSDKDGGMPIPKGLNIIWMCRIECRMYEFNQEFPDEVMSKMASLFEQGFYDYERKRDRTYEGLVITLLPGGKILLHLSGIGRIVYFATLQANEIKMSLAEFENDETLTETPKEYAQRTLSMYHQKALANFEKNSVPYSLWDRYLEKFKYKIKIEFENGQTVIDPDYSYKLTNGDMFYSTDGVIVDSLARLKKIVFAWSVADTTYTGHFHFNEEDVLDIFDRAYGNDRTQQGELSIRVSKYNNWFDIFLRVGDKEYKFDNEKRTQIHVFRRRPEDDKGYNFYDNYRRQDVAKFTGE